MELQVERQTHRYVVSIPALDEAEKEVFEFIEMNTPHQYWMGMSFLALSDIYLARGDHFSAINTLQSLIDYYTVPDDGIIANAKQRRADLADQVEEELSPGDEQLPVNDPVQ